ncbi:MAG: hypothetical protein ACWA5A_02420 [Marinibacterium sp.]
MRLHSAHFPLALLMISAACVPQPDPDFSGWARFAAFPDGLYQAFHAACTGPAQVYTRPRRDFAECRELLPPDMTAAIILGYDGTVDDLPQLVIRFATTREGTDYLVENDVFLNVPRRDNDALEIRIPDPRLGRTIDALYRRAGGVPEAAPAE